MTYLVYSYQYNDMRRPQVGAQRRTYNDSRDMDSLPPTVIDFVNVAAISKREALREGRPILRGRKPATCHLRNDWRAWSEEKRADRLFMICPSCGTFGSHIGEGTQ